MPFEPEEFEFYRDIKRPEEKQPEPQFVDVSKRKEERKKERDKRRKQRACKYLAFAICLGGIVGYGVGEAVDIAKPYVEGAITYSKNSTMIAELYDFYENNGGYLERLHLKYESTEDRSFFDDTPREIDFENEENMWITESGKKAGPLVDYYDGFDEYVSENNGGIGYYEIVREQNQIDELFGREPSTKCIYTPAELEEMLSKGMSESDIAKLGGK